MNFTCDPKKNQRNIALRGLSFDRAADFDFEGAQFGIDSRRDYGEVRRMAVGMLDERLHVLIFTETKDGIRVVSFRRANKRETRKWHARGK